MSWSEYGGFLSTIQFHFGGATELGGYSKNYRAVEKVAKVEIFQQNNCISGLKIYENADGFA